MSRKNRNKRTRPRYHNMPSYKSNQARLDSLFKQISSTVKEKREQAEAKAKAATKPPSIPKVVTGSIVIDTKPVTLVHGNNTNVIHLPQKRVLVEQEFIPPERADTDVVDLSCALKTVSSYLHQATNELKYLTEHIHDTDLETSDFLHSIELTDFNNSEKEDVFDKIKEIRERRRTYKRRQEYFEELVKFLNDNQNIDNKIDALRGKITKIGERQENASFCPRVRTDLKRGGDIKVGYYNKKEG